MRLTAYYLLFLLLILTSSSNARRRTCKKRGNDQENLSKPSICNPLKDTHESEADHHYYDRGVPKFGVVQKIPYLRASSACDGLEIHFSSACVRCGMCLAIADKINRTLLEVHEMMASNTWLNDTEAQLLLRTICDHSFKCYRLREMDGKRVISDNVPGSTLITTSVDELWGQQLQDLCHNYLDEIGDVQLYAYWRQWCTEEGKSYDLTTLLCKSPVGTLRDCRNMDNRDKHETLLFNSYDTKMKITVTYGKYG